ncbi:MAG: NAD regulator [Hyphomicrobiaceae bacterium]|nr:NAD regulator [Hyphomicrobiaceae bacterium]
MPTKSELRAAADEPHANPALGGAPIQVTAVTAGQRIAPVAWRDAAAVEIGLTASIVAVTRDEPVVLCVRDEPDAAGAVEGLPTGPFSPLDHRTLEIGLRDWVLHQTGLDLGYVEQLYTFGDRGRHAEPGDLGPHVVSIGYLALTRALRPAEMGGSVWRSWYHFFPWEDWRQGRPPLIETVIEPRLRRWAGQPAARHSPARPIERTARINMCFGLEGAQWDEEKVLERLELLYEAGLVQESHRDRPETAVEPVANLGEAMRFDHRRILATAIGRVRAKIKYRPVIFELMPDDFTLFELQKTVEAILGPHLHKQNFRRLVESAGLVEPTGEMKTRTGGRPAKLFRFRRDVLLERPSPGVRVKPGRA